MLRNIYLHGRLGKKFAKLYQFECATPAEAFRALIHLVPGFREEIQKGEYRVRAVRKGKSRDFDENMLTLEIDDADIHVTPVLAGRKNRGGLKAIIGIIIFVIAVVVTGGLAGLFAPMAGGAIGLTAWGMVAMFGVALALSGIAMMMAPTPKLNSSKKEDSFLFNGAENTFEQGGPVPLVYGQHLVGSTIVSAGIATEDIYANVNYPWTWGSFDFQMRYLP